MREKDLKRRRAAYALAAIDMQDVIEAARYLQGVHSQAPPGHDGEMPWRARRTLEVGLVVSYCRPFVSSKGGLANLSPHSDLTDGERALHHDLLRRRRQMYAHTDETLLRYVEHAEPTSDAGIGAVEVWEPPTALLPGIEALAVRNRDHFEESEAKARQDLAGLGASSET